MGFSMSVSWVDMSYYFGVYDLVLVVFGIS